MLVKSRITFFSFNFMFSYVNFIIFDFLSWVGNPNSGTEFIPYGDRLPEKIEHMKIRDLHSIILKDRI
jgi:hypothetical protein